jgi:hypothetical protein
VGDEFVSYTGIYSRNLCLYAAADILILLFVRYSIFSHDLILSLDTQMGDDDSNRLQDGLNL